MKDYYRFQSHPFAVEIERKVTSICRQLERWRYSPAALYRTQERLLKEICEIEDGIRLLRGERSKLLQQVNDIVVSAREQRITLATEEKAKLRELQLDADDIGDCIRILRYGRWVLRYVGDGIAWRMYGYRRDIIRALGRQQPVPFLTGKDGLEVEVKVFREIRALGRQWVPLLHDLTNCIRNADVSIFQNSLTCENCRGEVQKAARYIYKSFFKE